MTLRPLSVETVEMALVEKWGAAPADALLLADFGRALGLGSAGARDAACVGNAARGVGHANALVREGGPNELRVPKVLPKKRENCRRSLKRGKHGGAIC